MKKVLILFYFLSISSIGFSQFLLENSYKSFETYPQEFSLFNDTLENELTLFDIKHNAFYNMDLLLSCYERIIPLNNNIGLTLTAGLLVWDPANFIGQIGFLAGGPFHFAEIGIGYHVNPGDSEWNMAIFNLGYRLQLKKGFLFKAAIAYVNEPLGGIIPLLGLGYAF